MNPLDCVWFLNSSLQLIPDHWTKETTRCSPSLHYPARNPSLLLRNRRVCIQTSALETQVDAYKQVRRRTLTEGIAVVDEFLGNAGGELVVDFSQTLNGGKHALSQGTALVFTCSKNIKTAHYNKL